MKIAIYGTEFEDGFIPLFKKMVKNFRANRVGMVVYKPLLEKLQLGLDLSGIEVTYFSKKKKIDRATSLMLSIGGDGTFLDAVSYMHGFDFPIAGINCGRLGFLADITSDDVDDAINKFLKGDYVIEERSKLQVVEPNRELGSYCFALNEMTVHKLDNSSMITVGTYINGEFLANYWADGLIISTPTGSTAYSLSVGGPIVTPNLNGLIIAPIASHNLTVRPVVVPDNVEIVLNVEGRGNKFMLSIDHRSVPIDLSTSVRIKTADEKVKVVRFKGHNFYTTLRNKLMWGADKRN